MGSSLANGERSQRVKARVYMPDVDEFSCSSKPLAGERERDGSLIQVLHTHTCAHTHVHTHTHTHSLAQTLSRLA